MDWWFYNSCCAKNAADPEAVFCAECRHLLLRCQAFADCGGLVSPGGPCPHCVAPRLSLDAGATTQSKKGDEPNFGALIVALATIASAANNIPGGLLADAADSLDEVLHSLQSQSPVTVLREQRTKGLLKQLVEDIKAELAEPDVKTPSATKAVVAEAVKVAETELPKLDHMVEREDVVLRILTVSVIGTLNQRTSAIESVSKLAELYALPAPKEARVIGHGETTDRSRHAVQQATT